MNKAEMVDEIKGHKLADKLAHIAKPSLKEAFD